ncbi:methyl-coenzyme M reductase operon protein D [Methanocella arvoryzae]|uniref:Methyl-coenzyme M reductase, operon protein D n=1 Tax=Methanocella arvoryzae (strain DSM 22066 / NBRC 105507 / MRE50) TaxID=351160 RepID=Q0W342_METAR|nr:methyl-coenzyme M reductase operon protein D [Methanocella arvoryzae]CAJ37201.1 methyl-coenzyme M reductase, operon protein D [Methanocella arvoryzae MRE50]
MVAPVTGKNRLMQIEIFPERLLNIETAQALLNELNKIGGITRMIVYGPRLPKDDPKDLLDGKFDAREKKFLDIMGEKIELTVQVGRIFVEIENPGVKDKINEACRKTLPFPFEINEGLYIRTQKTLTDYVRKGGKVDDISVGMSDPGAMQKYSYCPPKSDDRDEKRR